MTFPPCRRHRAAAVVTTLVAGLALAACATSPGTGESPHPESPSSTPALSPSGTTSPSPSHSGSAPSASPSNSPTSSTDDVSVVIITLDVASGQVEVSGMVPELVEESGTCTAEIRRGDDVRVVSGSAMPARESTYCELLTFPLSELGPGDWQVSLSYESTSHRGSSAVASVTVP